MKKTYLKRGIASLSLGVFLLALSVVSSKFFISADSSEVATSDRVAISKVMLVVALVVIAIAAYFFAKMFEKTKY
jgi:hypothetical protein